MSRTRFKFSNIGGGMFRDGVDNNNNAVDNEKLYNLLGIGKTT